VGNEPFAQVPERKSGELAAAATQVVAHRVTRMVLAGPNPSARDRNEFKRMVGEKTRHSPNPGWP
jgi:hypothetical protein